MNATHSIRVLGRDLQVKSASTPEHVAQVESLVNQKLDEAGSTVSGGDNQVVAILAMLNLAEALISAQKELEAERHACRARVSGLIARLQEAV